MKIKLIDQSIKLPNCWKQCGATIKDWEDLKAGKEIDVKSVCESMNGLVDVITSPKNKKGGK